MNTFIKRTLASEIETNFLDAFESYCKNDNLDELFEAYLGNILHIGQVRQAEILLYNNTDTLIHVAESKWIRSAHGRESKVYSESWLLNYPVKHTVKRGGRTQIHPVFSVTLVDADTIIGFLKIQLEKLDLIDQNRLNQFHLIGLQLSSNIREIRLKSEVNEIKGILQTQISNNCDLLQQSTALSKELYAISAISARINQSMDFDKTLHRILTPIRKVFKAYSILIYTQSSPNSKIKMVANECEDASAPGSISGQYMESIGKNYLNEVLSSDKPMVKDRIAELFPAPKGMDIEPPITSLVGVPLNSTDSTIGAILLLYRSSQPNKPSGLRLLSGIANLLGMNIENKALYRQSIQKKYEVDFLFRSIVTFNKTLDLKAILTSVAEKGVEYCGITSRVYLFSHIKSEVIISHYKKKNNSYIISSSLREKKEFGPLETVYLRLSDLINEKPILICNVCHSKKIGLATRMKFCKLNMYSLIAVPLKVGQKKLGMLLLVRDRGATAFGQHEMEFTEALASAASLTIENARAYTASQEMSDFLEKKIGEKNDELLKIQARQRHRVENRKDIIFRVNKHNRFVFANKAMEFLSGLPRGILCHKDFSADGVVVAEDRPYINSLFRNIFSQEIPLAKDAEYQHVNNKGENHIISLTIFPEYDETGQVVGVEGVGQDVTEKKRLEAELKKAKDLALLGEFSGAVAHQMRNPLGNILMGTKRLEKALGLDGGKGQSIGKNDDCTAFAKSINRKHVADILTNVSLGVYNLNQVVTELLDYTKTLKLRRSTQRMDIIMHEIIQGYAGLLDQNQIKVYEYFDDVLPTISADAVLLGQAIQNVVYNAIQAMPSGGELVLIANISDIIPNQILLSIRDTGVGIDPSEVDRVFRPFFTTKKLGTGLGLSVAHRIVETHGGRIQICRNPCSHVLDDHLLQEVEGDQKGLSGTTVHIMLPITAGGDQKNYKPTKKKHESQDLCR